MRKFARILILFIIIFSCLFGFYYKYTSNENAKRFYNQGIGLYEQAKYSDAYYNFKQIKPISDLYELSLLKQYQCASNLSDKKTALLKLREIIKTTKNETIKLWAYYNEALLSQELGVTSENQLLKKFNYIHQKYPQTDFGIASAYKVAQLAKNQNVAMSKKNYIDYLSYAPSGKFARNSIEELKKMDIVFDSEEHEIIADAQYANSMYLDAINNYNKTLFSKNWYKIAKCYKALKNKEQEKKILLKAFEMNYSTVDEKEISSAIDRYITLSGGNKKQILQEFYSKYQKTYIFPTVTYKFAENSSSIHAIKLYEQVAMEYPNSIWASNSLWEMFWYNYKLGRYKTCEKIAKKHIGLYKDLSDAPRVAYWYGRALLKSRKPAQARDVFYDVINDYPFSYYSFLSARQLKMSKAKRMILRKPIVSYNLDLLNKNIFKDKTILQLAQNNDWDLIEEFKIDDKFISSIILHKKDKHPSAINCAKNELFNQEESNEDDLNQNKLGFSEQMLKLVYPIFYEEIINSYAKEFKQSPYLFLSLIREESHFDKNARSSAGALGLSQLMPDTANFIEKSKVSKETLLTPEENIRIGLKYFSNLVNQFDKDEYLAILAYNAGPGNIKKWKNNSSINSDEIDVFVENIPYLETKNYIKKILSSYWIYLNIYSPKNK